MYQIQLYVDDIAETYATEAEATAALDEAIAEEIMAVAEGYMEDVTEPSDYCIVELEGKQC